MKARSVTISMIFVFLFAVALGIMMIFAPTLGRWYGEFRVFKPVVIRCIIAAFYTCSVPAGVALYCLWRLLRNIRRGEMFVKENCQLLEVISWCCVEVSAVCFAACYHYVPFGLVSVAMLFVFLIVRVVCSCLIHGTALKEENSLTI